MRRTLAVMTWTVLAIGCAAGPDAQQATAPQGAVATATEEPRTLGLRPAGDTVIEPDMSAISDELRQVFDYIDQNYDEHVRNLQRYIQQPSISNTGEGIPETAQMVKGFFDDLGCQESRVYEVGTTEWGYQGNPVVYARCDEGAEKTLVLYWMYDTMPITQPDLWTSPPFGGELVQQDPFPKVMIGRGTMNSKGPHMAQLNALRSIKAVAGRLPVNVIFVAEGDEERMSMGLRKFMRENPDLFKGADGLIGIPGGQSFSGRGSIGGGSEGCVCFELTTSGTKWGYGPTYADIAGIHALVVDKPAWRHMEMLESLVDKSGRVIDVEGFYDDYVPPTPEQLERLKRDAEGLDLEAMAKNVLVARFMTDDPVEFLRMQRYGISFNVDGIWGGNMLAGAAGAIIPNKITSKHQIRYQANMDGIDLVEKIRRQLDKNGYADVELQMVGDVPWCKVQLGGELTQAQARAFDIFRVPFNRPQEIEGGTAPYWPAYLFAESPLNLPISTAGIGHGWKQHGTNEFWVIEGAGPVYGMAGAEKFQATVLYNYAGKN